MSSDSDRRACVTTWTDEGRLEWLILTFPRYAQKPKRASPVREIQLAWLTEDMLKPSTRSGGIAVRLK
jgi:hypothetical protein